MKYEVQYEGAEGGVITRFAYNYQELLYILAELNVEYHNKEQDRPKDLTKIKITTKEL